MQKIIPLRVPFQTQSPFLFAVHHLDYYPPGSRSHLGINAPLHNHSIGMDFGNPDGWNMYHGEKVPGFPQHPHRGFETITLCRKGFCDHHDSMNAAGRFGNGDCQWMTAGRGVCHSEMFPQINYDKPNTLDLFQIWLNLPKKSKLVDPHFAMHWASESVHVKMRDAKGKVTSIETIVGQMQGQAAPKPPPSHSWAADKDNHVAIWVIAMPPEATWEVPSAPPGINRSLYFFSGEKIRIGEVPVSKHSQLVVDATAVLPLENCGSSEVEILMLQGKPIDEPVAQHGPFVMNTTEEIRQAFQDYRSGMFGDWTWSEDGPVQERSRPRFARYPDGREEYPDA
eukprot:CAMPEP_0182442464 /NCGR_PEP_ID=MMETSP1172-20130603/1374_1 /TAXON_ID=708627 /ORGANISM="Timspurckia oligopyrenoides, Strain CCMP3278" /LENGTH=338 /DNA_ID=CAMNT_0024637335 /DNA_START=93 /DNA_END=1109 /DNA_ORIENTATION=-